MKQSTSTSEDPDIPSPLLASAIALPFHVSRVKGAMVSLRLIQPDDAEYVHSLRTDIDYDRHLSDVTGDAGAQRDWIEAYKTRESALRESYYVIERSNDGERCGIVRLYDITPNSFTWGSWILSANKPPKAALESAKLSFSVGFDRLALPEAFVDVKIENQRALTFYRRLNMREIRVEDSQLYLSYDRGTFVEDRPRLLKIAASGAV